MGLHDIESRIASSEYSIKLIWALVMVDCQPCGHIKTRGDSAQA